MSPRSGAIRQPANDASSFDISQRSPEQIAQLFTRWKEQRKRLARAQQPEAAPPRVVRLMPAMRPSAKPASAPAPEPADMRRPASRGRVYSADFTAILTSGDQAAAERIKRLQFRAPTRTGHRPGLRWTLVTAASVIALTAAAGTVFWSQQNVPSVDIPATVAVAAPAQPEPMVEPPLEIQTAAPFLPAATRLPAAEPWSMALFADPAMRPPSVEVAQEPATVNSMPIETAVSPATLTGESVRISAARAPAETPEDFITGAGGISPAAETGDDLASPPRQAAGAVERGNQKDRLQLNVGSRSAPSAAASTASTDSREATNVRARRAADESANGPIAAGKTDAGATGSARNDGNTTGRGTARGDGSSSSASGDADGSADGASNSRHSGDTRGSGSGSHGFAGGIGDAMGDAAREAAGNTRDAVGGALGGIGKAAEGVGRSDGKGLGGKGNGANAGGKGKGKDKDKGGKGEGGKGKGGGRGKD